MNKNWNDRADKDLFFTILSVKNIGVISGSEWTTIGNHMRSLGYGFTNEGCRQHFQGLRRAQHKADTNGGSSENPRKVDPTLNPITRRPGPGRGRPKKQPQQPAPMPIPSLPAQAAQPGQPPQPGQPQPEQIAQEPQPHTPTPVIPDGLPSLPEALPETLDLPIKDDTLDMSLKDDDHDENDNHDAKRIKLDEPPQDQSLDDEAVLALAAHSNPPSVDAYASEYPTAGLTGSDPHAFSYGGET
ncbi:Actin cytoskeleton-regulatory complex protein PAN1-like protein 1 [Colletotrichum truncatum]|uniref:Actin cytoskeleton-regulatory complex protein PAN1-like protein 1 n=1 Tax=Colletotrichum truncatum TaxID=5467 RepID=A0ACC3ZAJ1_COLTU|nr:Actin cytoskeleton-regulatory complex protein PAN1-like protein 1 [Colletotrichum truncatum]KAF6796129.1 Actin cytoskeleton-regulatory complex protein PAN1-like protein 1 [Colletotrichum truncatum]